MPSARADERRHQSTLVRNENKLDRELLAFFAVLLLAMKESFNEIGIVGARSEIQKAQPALKEILKNSYMRSGPDGMRLASEQLPDEDFSEEAVLLALLVWAEASAQSASTQITSTTSSIFDDLLAENAAGAETGTELPLEDIIDEMNKRNRRRTGTISSTETGKGVNRGSFETAEEIQKGLIFEIRKAWTSQKDLRVRSTHARANQRYTRSPIPVNEVFQVGASFGRFPHDSTLSAAESIGCRCYIRYRKVNLT